MENTEETKTKPEPPDLAKLIAAKKFAPVQVTYGPTVSSLQTDTLKLIPFGEKVCHFSVQREKILKCFIPTHWIHSYIML